VKFTITIEGQQDVRFWGTVASATKVEPAIGAVSSDGKHFRMVQQEGGVIDGTLLTNDTFEIFYVDAKAGASVVATTLYARQK
jgi:hypothetical protein